MPPTHPGDLVNRYGARLAAPCHLKLDTPGARPDPTDLLAPLYARPLELCSGEGVREVKVFISWSGDESKALATLLRDWLPMVLAPVDPFVSEEDVAKGTRWAAEISSRLEECSYGLICITPDNGSRPWLTFEAGALSKSVKDRVSPVLLGVRKTDLTGPLTMFQATSLDAEDVLRLLKSLNEASGDASIPEDRLIKLFEALWPSLLKDITQLQTTVAARSRGGTAGEGETKPRSEVDLLEELVVRVREQSRLLSSPDELLPPGYLRLAVGSASTRPSTRVLRQLFEAYVGLRDRVLTLVKNAEHSDDHRAVLNALDELAAPISFLTRDLPVGTIRSSVGRRRVSSGAAAVFQAQMAELGVCVHELDLDRGRVLITTPAGFSDQAKLLIAAESSGLELEIFGSGGEDR